MNTVEMALKLKRGTLMRRSIWSDKNLCLKYMDRGEVKFYHADRGIVSTSPVYFLDFLEVDDWEEWQPQPQTEEDIKYKQLLNTALYVKDKAEQTLAGQYKDGQALKAVLGVLKKHFEEGQPLPPLYIGAQLVKIG